MSEWYFNLKTHEVEEGKQSHGLDRLGPYPTKEAAAEALETVQKRNEAADAKDALEN